MTKQWVCLKELNIHYMHCTSKMFLCLTRRKSQLLFSTFLFWGDPDMSADLTELSRTPVTVICAGVKSILDIPKTLEVLETYGVAVGGWQCNEFPAFFSNDSGVQCPLVFNNEHEVRFSYFASFYLKESGHLYPYSSVCPYTCR